MKNTVFALLLSLFIASGAIAQLDPDDDGIGIYFDPCACVNCLDLPMGDHTGYVVITHPTSEMGVGAWEATITYTGPAVLSDWEMIGNAVNNATLPNEFSVNLDEPLINPFTYPAVVVATFNAQILDDSQPVLFYVDGIESHSIPEYDGPAYVDGGDFVTLKPLQMIQGSADLPVAVINGDCSGVVASEITTFDNLKALYR